MPVALNMPLLLMDHQPAASAQCCHMAVNVCRLQYWGSVGSILGAAVVWPASHYATHSARKSANNLCYCRTLWSMCNVRSVTHSRTAPMHLSVHSYVASNPFHSVRRYPGLSMYPVYRASHAVSTVVLRQLRVRNPQL